MQPVQRTADDEAAGPRGSAGSKCAPCVLPLQSLVVWAWAKSCRVQALRPPAMCSSSVGEGTFPLGAFAPCPPGVCRTHPPDLPGCRSLPPRGTRGSS